MIKWNKIYILFLVMENFQNNSDVIEENKIVHPEKLDSKEKNPEIEIIKKQSLQILTERNSVLLSTAKYGLHIGDVVKQLTYSLNNKVINLTEEEKLSVQSILTKYSSSFKDKGEEAYLNGKLRMDILEEILNFVDKFLNGREHSFSDKQETFLATLIDWQKYLLVAESYFRASMKDKGKNIQLLSKINNEEINEAMKKRVKSLSEIYPKWGGVAVLRNNENVHSIVDEHSDPLIFKNEVEKMPNWDKIEEETDKAYDYGNFIEGWEGCNANARVYCLRQDWGRTLGVSELTGAFDAYKNMMENEGNGRGKDGISKVKVVSPMHTLKDSKHKAMETSLFINNGYAYASSFPNTLNFKKSSLFVRYVLVPQGKHTITYVLLCKPSVTKNANIFFDKVVKGINIIKGTKSISKEESLLPSRLAFAIRAEKNPTSWGNYLYYDSGNGKPIDILKKAGYTPPFSQYDDMLNKYSTFQ